MADEQIIVHKNDRPDSIEVGTPGKNGALKVYFNATDLEGAKILVENAKKLLEFAKTEG